MHTQLGAGGSSAVGMAAGLRALKRKGKIKDEKINSIAFCGDLGGGDMGLGGISGALQTDLDLLIIMYDNESAANTDIQATGLTTYGAQTTFTPPGKKFRIMQRRWKKNVAGMLAVGHPTCKYVATACATYPPMDFLNKVRKALAVGGPTFIHTYDPCPNKRPRLPVREFLNKQGRFAHLTEEDIEYVQKMVNEMWNEWEIPGVAPIKGGLKA